jgi:glutamate carboxypeptidase
MQLQELGAWVDSQKIAIETALRDLVELNTHTRNHEGVAEGMRRLEALVESMGLQIEPVLERHRLIKAGTGKNSPRIMLVAHMDTVFPLGDGFDTYEPLEGGLVRGPGTGDIKGGLLMGLWTLWACQQMQPDCDVQLIVCAEEEIGSPSLRGWYKEGEHGADYAIGLEPGFPQGDLSADVDLGVVYQRKGYGALRWTVHGKASHSGVPHEGINAIEAAAERIVRWRELNAPEKGVTVTVGMIEGGRSPNTVPGEVTGTVSWRFERLVDGEAVRDAAQDILCQTFAYNENLGQGETVTYDLETFIPPMEKTPVNMKMVDIVLEEAKALGHPVLAIARGGGSDANWVSQSGTPSICGMGAPTFGLHTHEEMIHLPMMFERIELLTRTVMRLMEEKPT